MRPVVLISALLAIISFTGKAQGDFMTRSGKIRINASTPLEDIKAENTRVNAILKPANKAFGVVLLISEFEFPRKLMQEHFNENYMESEAYPKATFSGTIQGNPLPETGGSCTCPINGTLTLHGVARPLQAIASITRSSSGYQLQSTFTIRPEDHNIEIPRLLFKKIAEEVQVEVDLLLVPSDTRHRL